MINLVDNLLQATKDDILRELVVACRWVGHPTMCQREIQKLKAMLEKESGMEIEEYC